MTVRQRTAPTFLVKVIPEGQQAVRVDLSDRVISFTFEDAEHRADKLVLSVNNWDLRNFDEPAWRKGNLLEVSWGYPGEMAPARQVVIQKVTGFQTLNVEGYAKSVLMNQMARCRVFENLRRSDVAQQVAKENGYGPNLQDIEDTEEVFPVITQARMTDAQLLRHLAAKEGFEFFIDFDGLHFHQRRLGQRPVRTLQWYTAPEVGELLSLNVENDVTAKPGAVQVRGRDPIAKKDIDERGSNATTERDTLAEVIEIPDTETLETRLERRVASEEIRPTSHPTASAAKREADARYRSVQHTTVQLTATTMGDPSLLAKTVLEMQGIGRRLSGKYNVRSAKHKIDSSGYTVELKCIRDGTSEVGGIASKGKLNPFRAEDHDEGALRPVEVVSGETGETRIEYRDTRGRAAGIEDPKTGASRPGK